MKCNEIHEWMPDVAAGFSEPTADESKHLEGWQAPEPSPYFDVRFQARLREEMAMPQARWTMHWFRRPVLAAALTVMLGVSVGLFVTRGKIAYHPNQEALMDSAPGTAVSDLQTLDKNHDMYSDFDLLDDLDLQQNVAANP